MKITISAHDHIQNFSTATTPAYARVYASQSFTNDDNESVGAGSIDSVNYVKQVAVSYAAGVTTIPSFTTTNRIDSTTYGTGGVYATYTLTLHNSRGKRVAIVYTGLVVPTTPTTTTWENINTYSNALPQPYRNTYYTAPQVDTILDGLDLAPDATDVIIGKSRLSYLQTTLLDPVAVGENDPKWRAVSDSVYLETYGQNQAGVTAAITAIGSTVTELIVSEVVTISSNSTFPSTCTIRFTGRGAFSVNSSRTLTINSLDPPPAKQVFSGAGTVTLGKNATGGIFRLEWWAGITNSGDCSAAMSAVISSMTTSTGSVCLVGPGVWKFDGVTVPDGCFFVGAGRTEDITSGTVFKPYSTSAIDLFTFASGAAYSGLRDCTVSTDGTVSTSSRAVVISTNATTSFGVQFKNVHMQASLASSTVFELNDGGSNYEAVGISMKDVMITVPVSGIGFKSESINTSFSIDNLVFSTARAAKNFYISAAGWMQIKGLDARGSGSYVSSTTVDRTITGSVTSNVLTLTSGAFVQNDVGQPFTRGATTGYIKGLLTSTTATCTGSDVGAGTLTMERYVPSSADPGPAEAVFHIVGDHNGIQVDGFADEGFRYFLVNDASTNVSPITFNGMTIQSRIVFNAAAVLVFNNCALRSGFIYDVTGVTGSVFFNGCSWINNTTNIITGGTTPELTYPRWQGVLEGATRCYTDTSFHEDLQQMLFETRTNFYGRVDGETYPLATFASVSNSDQPAIRIGRLNPYTWSIDHYYDIFRDAAVDGYLDFAGSQAFPNRGYRFNANVCAVTFRGTELTPSQITSNQNDYIPADSSLVIRLSSDASRNITGMAFTDTQQAGEMHILYNVGSFNIVLQNQSGSSTAAYRFQTDTNADVTLAPYQAAFCIYDATSSRWRVSKWNISGLTSNGAAITASLAATFQDTVQCNSDVGVTGDLTVGGEVNGTTINCSTGVNISNGGDLSFTGTTGQSRILLTDNLADALSIAESGNSYLTFTTTNSGEKVKAIKNLEGTLGITSISPTAGIGYATGAGGAQTQGTSKSTGVTSNTITTAITMHNASLAAGAIVSFTFTNSAIAATDQVIVTHASAGTSGAYTCNAFPGSGSAVISIRNNTAGALAEAIVLRVSVYKAVSS